ncbi:hypothetical protein H8E06_01075 [bacterium]|nr:hypothetical protein [bacterium]
MAPRRVETAANIITDVEQLKKTIYTGNGEPSLTTQVSSLTTKVEYLEKSINEKLDHHQECIADKIESLKEAIDKRDMADQADENRKNQMTTAIIAGVISIVVAVLAYFLTKI